jgi:hypothetical protein
MTDQDLLLIGLTQWSVIDAVAPDALSFTG